MVHLVLVILIKTKFKMFIFQFYLQILVITRNKHVNGVELKKKQQQQQQSISNIQQLITERTEKSSFIHDLSRALSSENTPSEVIPKETRKAVEIRIK